MPTKLPNFQSRRYGASDPMAEPEPYQGRVLAGRYRLTHKMNEGGMGAIWQAEHLVLRAPVAVKLIDRELLEQDTAVDRFMREAQAAASLRSPHVVQILDYGVDIDVPFIVMELLEGETFAERLRRRTRLSKEEAARLLTHVGRAMARAHEAGIVHRDLKPENIFIVRNEDEDLAKVLDFGVAKINRADLTVQGAQTRTGSLLGTPYYMSPEQVQGNKDVDYRSDLWSLGVIAFECLVGERPFASNGLGDLVLQICVRDMPVPSSFASVPKGFDSWFLKACERDVEKRFQSAREMIDELRRALEVELAGQTDSVVDPIEARGVDPVAPSRGRITEAATVVGGPPGWVEVVGKSADDTVLEPDLGRAPRKTGFDVSGPRLPEEIARSLLPPVPLRESWLSRFGTVLQVAMGALFLGVVGVFAIYFYWQQAFESPSARKAVPKPRTVDAARPRTDRVLANPVAPKKAEAPAAPVGEAVQPKGSSPEAEPEPAPSSPTASEEAAPETELEPSSPNDSQAVSPEATSPGAPTSEPSVPPNAPSLAPKAPSLPPVGPAVPPPTSEKAPPPVPSEPAAPIH